MVLLVSHICESLSPYTILDPGSDVSIAPVSSLLAFAMLLLLTEGNFTLWYKGAILPHNIRAKFCKSRLIFFKNLRWGKQIHIIKGTHKKIERDKSDTNTDTHTHTCEHKHTHKKYCVIKSRLLFRKGSVQTASRKTSFSVTNLMHNSFIL